MRDASAAEAPAHRPPQPVRIDDDEEQARGLYPHLASLLSNMFCCWAGSRRQGEGEEEEEEQQQGKGKGKAPTSRSPGLTPMDRSLPPIVSGELLVIPGREGQVDSGFSTLDREQILPKIAEK